MIVYRVTYLSLLWPGDFSSLIMVPELVSVDLGNQLSSEESASPVFFRSLAEMVAMPARRAGALEDSAESGDSRPLHLRLATRSRLRSRATAPARPPAEAAADAKMWATIGTLLLGFLVVASLLASRSVCKGNGKSARKLSATKKPRTYTKAEVSLHNSRNDCWIIVKDKVYDVTSYVEEHPGADSILNNAGGDSTEGFFGPQHATRVFDMVDEFYIGDLEL